MFGFLTKYTTIDLPCMTLYAVPKNLIKDAHTYTGTRLPLLVDAAEIVTT